MVPRTAATGMLVAAMVACRFAHADPASPGEVVGPAFVLDPAIEVPLIILNSFAVLGLAFREDLGRSECAPLCDPAGVNRLDRWSAGSYDRSWSAASDAALGGAIGLAVLGAILDGGLQGGGQDALVIGESLLMTAGLTTVVKYSVRRSRPYLYSEEAPLELRGGGYGGLSFPSGHVGLSAALATSVFSVSRSRHPGSPAPWILLGAGAAVTGTIAVCRVVSGKHFLTDVATGALIGSLVGLLVPALHEERGLRVLPTAGEDSAGVLVAMGF